MKTPLEKSIDYLRESVEHAKQTNRKAFIMFRDEAEIILHHLSNLQQAQESTHPFNRKRR